MPQDVLKPVPTTEQPTTAPEQMTPQEQVNIQVKPNTVEDFVNRIDLTQISKTPLLDFFEMQDDMGLKGKIVKGMAREHFRLNQLLELDFIFRFKTKSPPIIQLFGPTGSGKSTAMISLMLKWCAINKTKFFLKLVFDDINRMFDAILSKPDYPIGTPFATDEGDEQFGGLNTAIESMDTKNTEKRCRALGYPIFYACPNIMVHQSHFIFETDGLIRDQNLWVRAAKVLVHDADGNLRGSLLLPAPRKDVLEAYFALPKALMMDKDHLRNIAKSQYLKADEYVDALVAGKITCEGHAFEEMKNFEQRLWFIIKTSKYRTKAMAKYIISGYDMKRPPEEEKPEKKSKKKEDEKEAKEETPKRGRGRPTKKEEEEQDEEPVSVPESKDNTQTKLEDTPQSGVEEDADELN